MLNACQQDAGDHGLAFSTLRLDNNSFGSNFNLPGNQSFIDYLNDDSVDLDWINSLPESGKLLTLPGIIFCLPSEFFQMSSLTRTFPEIVSVPILVSMNCQPQPLVLD